MIESELRLQTEETKEFDMESRRFALVFIGPPTSGKSTLANYIAETLHLPIIQGSRIINPNLIPTDGRLIDDDVFNESLERRLALEPSTGHIFDGIPRTKSQAKVIAEWSKKSGFPLHVIDLNMEDTEVTERTLNREVCSSCHESYHHKVKPALNSGVCDIDGSNLVRRMDDNDSAIKNRLDQFRNERDILLETLKENGATIHTFDANGKLGETSRTVFKELSPLAFEDPELATKYFEFRDLCEQEKIDFMLVSGACSYIYRGRRPLKDLDIIVPSSDDLAKISGKTGIPTEKVESSYASSQYLNFSSGVELVSDLSVLYSENGEAQKVPFDFEDLNQDSRVVRFFGESCKIMSPEWLIVFKACLGRAGTDDFGHNKNDYQDAFDVTISQPVDFNRISDIAKRIGAEARVNSGLEIVKNSGF